MLLCIMNLLHENLPCSENYFLFSQQMESTASPSESGVTNTKSIAQPKSLKGLSPISKIKQRKTSWSPANLTSAAPPDTFGGVLEQSKFARKPNSIVDDSPKTPFGLKLNCAGSSGNGNSTPGGCLSPVTRLKDPDEVVKMIPLSKFAKKKGVVLTPDDGISPNPATADTFSQGFEKATKLPVTEDVDMEEGEASTADVATNQALVEDELDEQGTPT